MSAPAFHPRPATPILDVPTREEIDGMRVGDYAIDCFGSLALVVEIYARGDTPAGRGGLVGEEAGRHLVDQFVGGLDAVAPDAGLAMDAHAELDLVLRHLEARLGRGRDLARRQRHPDGARARLIDASAWDAVKAGAR